MSNKKQTQLPECCVVPGLLTGINYKKLIEQQSQSIIGNVETTFKENTKQKVYSKKTNLKRKI